ncbi:MAG: hypothetical protein MZV63_36545 [Marinilabiliales bacterium]|nr:hypothetical protein [Marinilabiliales bacterium]
MGWYVCHTLKLFPVFIFALPGVIACALFPGELQGDATKQTFVLLARQTSAFRLAGIADGFLAGSHDNLIDWCAELSLNPGGA